MRRLPKALVAWCAGIRVSIMLPYACLDHTLGGPVSTWWYRRPFDAEKWQAAGYSDTRVGMVDDVVSGRLDGLTRNEVVRLLGTRRDSGLVSDEYVAGTERGQFFSGTISLRVIYDSTGRVERQGGAGAR